MVAYFCAEYALSVNKPLYAGGLGILAGDLLREASDTNFPMIAIGLYYHSPDHIVDQKYFSPVDISISVPIQDHDVNLKVWLCHEGKIPVYLLDTYIDSNTAQDKTITDELYVSQKEARLKQDLILGIGGFRLLKALNINPDFYHLNEGNSAFLAFELANSLADQNQVNFSQGLTLASKRIVFTNHTLITAGHELYSDDLVSLLLSKYASDINIPLIDLINLGLVQESSTFSLTMLALRLSGKVNAVSHLHATKAAQIWAHHPMVPITNGIHISTWDKLTTSNHLPEAHLHQKQLLLDHISQTCQRHWSSDTLLIGWARRIVTYKRPLAIFSEIEKLKNIARRHDFPVRFVFSGLSHPADIPGLQALDELKNIITNQIPDLAVYLPNYDFKLAQLLTSGCDVWLNTPIVGFEACGTSSMKAALNGTLFCTTADGWIPELHEATLKSTGWILDNDQVSSDFIQKLENTIVPEFYTHKNVWESKMAAARQLIQTQFSATRMLREYQEKLYI